MATSWKQILNDIDTDTDCLVHGYFRNSEEKSRIVIPTLVIYTCLMYYWIREYFADINEEEVFFSENRMKLECQSHLVWNNTSFGNIKIDSMCNDIFKWKLKIPGDDKLARQRDGIGLLLGISSVVM